MARPTTKPDLIHAAREQYDRLWKLIDTMPEEEQNAAFRFDEAFLEKHTEAHWERDKNLRDVLVHLEEWHRLFLNWVKDNQNGIAKPFIPEPYNWKSYGQMNVSLWRRHRNTPLADSKEMLKASHARVMEVIGQYSNEELFAKKALPWTGGSTLGSYCISVTSSHYDWAVRKLKQHIKSYS